MLGKKLPSAATKSFGSSSGQSRVCRSTVRPSGHWNSFLSQLFSRSEPKARAVCREGCSDTPNTFLGEDALTNNTGGRQPGHWLHRTFHKHHPQPEHGCRLASALFQHTGSFNTANGGAALGSNTTGSNNTALNECTFEQHNRQRQHSLWQSWRNHALGKRITVLPVTGTPEVYRQVE